MALERLRLVAEGRLSVDEGEGTAPMGFVRPSDISNMVRLLPKFNERDPDIFFSLFESVADDRGWSDSERMLLGYSKVFLWVEHKKRLLHCLC